MATKTVSYEAYGATLRVDDEKRRDAVIRALYTAALIGETIVAKDTPVDKGQAKNAWSVDPTSKGAILYNDAPHAGILELGSRPHRPPFMPILRWVVRKFGTGKKSFEDISEVDSDLYAMAIGVVRKIEREGTRAHYMVRDNLSKLNRITKREVERVLGAM